MDITNIGLQCLQEQSAGLLSKEDLHFFYYDISVCVLTGVSAIFNWDVEVDEYISSKSIIVDNVDLVNVPTCYIENTVLFYVEDRKESKAMSFFRHLRNAFSHYRISRYNDEYFIKDMYEDKSNSGEDIHRINTMVGRIKCEDLHQLCYLFMKQKERLEQESITTFDYQKVE